MKYTYSECPASMQTIPNFGFSWHEFVLSIPSPLMLVTTYKPDRVPNACMQAWASFTTADHGTRFFALLSSVNKGGHLYQTLHDVQCAVINFMDASMFDACMATVRNNGAAQDELAASGLTAVPAAMVDAPMAEECFMNLECRYAWEKEIVPGDDHVLVCLEVVCAHIDERHLADRTGDKAILYNMHHAIDPEHFPGTAHDYAAVLTKVIDEGEY